MGAFFDLFTILGLIALLIGMAVRGVMTPDQTAGCLVVLAILIAISRAAGRGLASTVLRIAVPLLSILALALYCGDGTMRGAGELLGTILAITVMLFAIYIIVSGPLRR